MNDVITIHSPYSMSGATKTAGRQCSPQELGGIAICNDDMVSAKRQSAFSIVILIIYVLLLYCFWYSGLLRCFGVFRGVPGSCRVPVFWCSGFLVLAHAFSYFSVFDRFECHTLEITNTSDTFAIS